MTKRGKILRGTEAGLGLLSVDGQEIQFGLRDVWRGTTPPAPGMIVQVDLAEDASLISISPVSDSQIAKEQAEAMAIAARDKGRIIASAAIGKFGLPTLIATGLLMVGWFFLSAVNIQTFLGKLDLSFWQLLGFLNSGSAFETMMQGRGGASAGFYGFLAIVALAGPYVAYFWKDKRANLCGLLPLLFMLMVWLMLRSTVNSSMGADASGPLGDIARQGREEVMKAVSLGLGSYLSGLISLYFAGIAAKKFLLEKAIETHHASREEQVRRTAVLLLFALFWLGRSATAQTYTVLHTYPIGSGATSGIGAPALMSQGRDGDLYTTILNNGTENEGSVFKITPNGDVTTIYSFCSETSCADGFNPLGGVTLGFDGNFYGTTHAGGTGVTHPAGTVFKVTPLGQLTTLHTFANGTDEGQPTFPPLQGQDGNFYGVSEPTYNGQYGANYKVSGAGALSVLSDFNFTNGADPNAPVYGIDGNLYGTTVFGGSKNLGVVYKMTKAGKVTVLHNFVGYPTDGCYPEGKLVQGSDGNFYGTTYKCGTHNAAGGTVFKISPSGTYTLLYSFCAASFCTDGSQPLSGLVQATDNNFYGASSAGGTKNTGTLYKITPAGVHTSLYNFCDPSCNGFGPATPLILHTNGRFYGNTNGNSLGGAVFYSLNVALKPFVSLVNWTSKVGKTVEILGQGFNGTTQVSFNGVPATFNNVSDTYMTAVVPAGATTGQVKVTTFTTSFNSDRIFLVTPQITSFTPTSGVVGGSVVITGISLTQTSKVTIGGKPATFTVNSDKQVTATVPAGAVTGNIGITTLGGAVSSAAKFAVVPSISSFTPTSGPVGTSVTISGHSFTKAISVKFGAVAATSFQVINDAQVDALVPSGAVTGQISVTTIGGTGTSTTNFTVTP